MEDLSKLLKDAPRGMKLYSPLFGQVEFVRVDKQSDYPIDVIDCKGNGKSFTEFGVYFADHPDAECLLFPSKDCRTWEGWKAPVKPNFKTGDWIITDKNHVWLVDEDCSTTGYLYRLIAPHGEVEVGEYEAIDAHSRLWNIADAKDGDVLATDNGWTCIFKAFDGCAFSSYCFMDSQRWFYEVGSEVHTPDSRINGKIHPATKEQRDLLFAKMKEAGYEWDEKTKELRKTIKPKFKVGDNIKTGNQIDTIAEIDNRSQLYYCESGRTIYFANQDLWELDTKPHYDIANFKPFDKVLIRVGNKSKWTCDFFSYYHKGFHCIGTDDWSQCIPYNDDTKHLLGTTDMPSKEFINW